MAVCAGVPERVLVLGGTGFLGSRVARTFLARGSDVTLLSRQRDLAPPSVDGRTARLRWGHPQDPATLAAAIAESDHVVHALGGLNPLEASLDQSAAVTRSIPTLVRVLDEIRDRPGVRLTYLSSGGAVYGDRRDGAADEHSACTPLSAYGISKLTAERYIAMYVTCHGVDARVARVANAYGPGQVAGRGQGLVATLLDAACTGRPIRIYGTGTQVRDYIHADDVAQAVVGLSCLPGEPLIVNVATGTGHSIREVVALVEETTGRLLELDWAPGRDFDVQHNVLDVTCLSSLIDWHPIALPDGIEATYRDSLDAHVAAGTRSA